MRREGDGVADGSPAAAPAPRLRAGSAGYGVRPANAITWRNRFIQLLDHFPLPVAACDSDGTILVANPPLAGEWRTMPGRLAGRGILTLFDPLPPEHADLLRQAVRQRTGTRLRLPVSWGTPGGGLPGGGPQRAGPHRGRVSGQRHGELTIDLVRDAPEEPLTLLAVLFVREDADGGRTPAGEDGPARGRLTDVQARILALAAAGATTVQIAAAVGLSVDGITYHLERLSRSWGVRGRTALVARAYATGVLLPGTWPPELAGPSGSAP